MGKLGKYKGKDRGNFSLCSLEKGIGNPLERWFLIKEMVLKFKKYLHDPVLRFSVMQKINTSQIKVFNINVRVTWTLIDYRSQNKEKKTNLFLQISDPLRHWK
jgi:hypothetical protein